MAFETTKKKVERMFKPEVLQKFADNGLMIVDKQDFEITMQTYADAVQENKALKLQVKMQKARLEQLQQKSLGI